MTTSKIALITVVTLGLAGLLGVNGYVLWKMNSTSDEDSGSSSPSVAQNQDAVPSGTPANINAVISRKTSQNGPWNNDLIITTSSSITGFASSSERFVESAGVPTLAKTSDGTLYASFQWFPDVDASFDKVATSISHDNGVTWTDPETVAIADMPSTLQRAFDPTLVVLPDDTLRMYFTTSERGSQDTYIASATSSDGVHYTFTGTAMTKTGARLYDSAVVPVGETWLMSTPYAPNFGTHHGTSTDGITFTYTGVNSSNASNNWTGNYLVDNGSIYFFGTDTGSGVWYATSADGEAWSSAVFTGIRGGDPAVIKADNGTYIMVYTSNGKVK